MTFFGGEGDRCGEKEGGKRAQRSRPDARGISAETKLPYLPHCTSEPCHDMSVLEGPEINKRKNFKNHSISS